MELLEWLEGTTGGQFLLTMLVSMVPVVELRGGLPFGVALGLSVQQAFWAALIGNLLPVPFILLFIPAILDFMARFKIFRPIVLWLRKKADKHKHKVLGGEGSVTEGGENATEECDFNGKNIEKRDTPPTLSENEGAEAVVCKAAEATAVSETEAIGSSASEAIDTVDASRDVRPMTRGIFIALILFVAIPLPGTGAWTGTLAASFLDMGFKSTVLAVSLGVILAGCIMAAVSAAGLHIFGL